MKRFWSILIVCVVAVSAAAVPARRGWQSRTQADGTTIEVQTIGDEYYHYTINRDGKQVVRNAAGMYEVVGDAPTAAVAKARAQNHRRAKKAIGIEPYPAPRGLLILANFSDVAFQPANTAEVIDSLVNAVNCQVNNGFGSAAQFFKDQSNGLYQPVFDVYGPVTLSKEYSYYGGNVGEGDNAEDQYATDAVIEACILANEQYAELNFADYDFNNDGYVDFVYVIYAGKGEADSDDPNTIWPHNYSIQEIVKYYRYGYTNYQKSQTLLDDVYLDTYAMSQEQDGGTGRLAGNGTFCHEFSHVLGLPDFYDTSYGTNYSSKLTPNEWDLMDGGAYNGNGHCPPNYSVWEKYFMGWITPENYGDSAALLTLYPSGSEAYNCYQINESGELEPATQKGLNYYIEYREKKGWDTYLPSSGMLIWKVNFDASLWQNNMPNHSNMGAPHYTLDIPSGTRIGTGFGKKNVWPYSNKTTWEGVEGKPLTNITQSGNTIKMYYIGEPQDVEHVEVEKRAQKIMRDGQIMIVRGNKLYDLLGNENYQL